MPGCDYGHLVVLQQHLEDPSLGDVNAEIGESWGLKSPKQMIEDSNPSSSCSDAVRADGGAVLLKGGTIVCCPRAAVGVSAPAVPTPPQETEDFSTAISDTSSADLS